MLSHQRFSLPGLFFIPIFCAASGVSEFCLEGELDLGARYQGMQPDSGEFVPTTWCVISEDQSSRVLFYATGRSNPDMDGSWRVAYLPPDTVRIVNSESPPDIEFRGVSDTGEAARVRRIDPRRLVEEFRANPKSLPDTHVDIRNERLMSARTSADLPLRGHVSVEWLWDWRVPDHPALKLMMDGELLFKATGRWRDVPSDEAKTLWMRSNGVEPVAVPGDRWPARIKMRLIELTDGVYLVRGVRTGFQHIVVDTEKGLVIGDAPAGWVEFHHLPPTELVPGLGVSGLSEKLIDFLKEQFPKRPIHAVAITHFHDDHAGGARAFAAVSAKIYATQSAAEFLTTALNRSSMPNDRLARHQKTASIKPVANTLTVGGGENAVELLSMGRGPHVSSMLGVLVPAKKFFFVSDVHVPRSDDEYPAEHRVVTECWFAGWAVKNLADDVRVINSHSATVTPVSRLAKYLQHDRCKGSQTDGS